MYRGHDDDLDLGHLVDAHHVVAVEIGLLDRAAIDRDFAVQRCGETSMARSATQWGNISCE
jgi:hypothetical protein